MYRTFKNNALNAALSPLLLDLIFCINFIGKIALILSFALSKNSIRSEFFLNQSYHKESTSIYGDSGWSGIASRKKNLCWILISSMTMLNQPSLNLVREAFCATGILYWKRLHSFTTLTPRSREIIFKSLDLLVERVTTFVSSFTTHLFL